MNNTLNIIRNFIDTFKCDYIKHFKGCILISGGMIGFDRGISNFLNCLYEKKTDYFYLSEVTGELRHDTDVKIEIPHICVPHLLAKEVVVLNENVPYTKNMENLCKSKIYLQEALQNLLERYQGELTYGYIVNFLWYSYRFICNLLTLLEPKEVILWNQFYAFHMVFRGICAEMNIPVRYMEFGSVPGTFALGDTGQMGESSISRHYLYYRYKYICHRDLKKANKVITYIEQHNYDRNPQPDAVFSVNNLLDYDESKPTFLYLGHNDYESGTCPYNDIAKKYHSPIFKTSDDAAKYIWEICKKNKWNFIYKPHPLVVGLGRKYESNGFEKMNIVTDVNIHTLIRNVDVCITILSQSSYNALFHSKPVIMLGYNHLRGKGCTYEAFTKEIIKDKMKIALQKGMTKRQKKNFKRHIAIMLKYCLYDDMTERELRYGMIL